LVGEGLHLAGVLAEHPFQEGFGFVVFAFAPERIRFIEVCGGEHCAPRVSFFQRVEGGGGTGFITHGELLAAQGEQSFGMEGMGILFRHEVLQGLHGGLFLALFPEEIRLEELGVARGEGAGIPGHDDIAVFHGGGRCESLGRFQLGLVLKVAGDGQGQEHQGDQGHTNKDFFDVLLQELFDLVRGGRDKIEFGSGFWRGFGHGALAIKGSGESQGGGGSA
jgi:hypothetical protein